MCEDFNKTLEQELPDLSWLSRRGYCGSLVKKVQDNKCVELAIEEGSLWGPRSVVKSSLKGEVAEIGID